MKQIVVVTNEKNNYEAAFSKKGYYVTWSPVDLQSIISVRDRSNVLFFCVSNADPDLLKSIGLYLRDLCIEDEKIIYLYGSREAVDILNRLIPTIYVQKAAYAFVGTFTAMLDDLAALEGMENTNKPALLIIDDDNEFIEQLRILLDSRFTIYVSHNDLEESGFFLMHSDVVLLGTRAKFGILEIMDFFRLVVSRKRSAGLHFYYIASDDEERDKINAGGESGSIAFSRTIEPRRLADFFVRNCLPV